MTARMLKNLLFLSVAVNLLLAAVLTTRLWMPIWHEPPRGTEALIQRLTADLPSKDADLLRASFQANQAKLAALMEDLQRARREVHDKLVAEPFDGAAFSTAVTVLRAKRQAYDTAVQDTIVQTIPNFSPEGRRKLWRPHKD